MSLMDTFVQVFEFDTRQANEAFKKVQRSTDDIIDAMKQTQQAAEQSSLTIGSVMAELWRSLQSLSTDHKIHFTTNANDVSAEISQIMVRLDAVGSSLSALDALRQNTETAWSSAGEALGHWGQSLQTEIAQLKNDLGTLSVGDQKTALEQVKNAVSEFIHELQKIPLTTADGATEVERVMAHLHESVQGLSVEHAIGFVVNASEAIAQTDAIKTRLDTVTNSMANLDTQRAISDEGMRSTSIVLSDVEAHYQALQQELTLLNQGVTDLANAEHQGITAKRLSNAIIQALQGNYTELIHLVDTMKVKGIEAANSEINAQRNVQQNIDSTQSKYQRLGNTVMSFVKKAFAAEKLLAGAKALVEASITRSAEIESLDNLGKKINVAAVDVDAFAGSMAELGGSRDAAQADLSAMAKSFGFAKNSMEKVLQTADKVQGMKFDKAKATLSALGVTDDKTVELMMKGRKELEHMMEAQKEYSGINKDSIEQSIRFNKAMRGFQQSSDMLKNSLLEMVIPILAKGVEWINRFVSFCKENQTFIVGFFIAMGAAITAFYLPAMLSAAATTLAFTWPILALIAVIALLATAFALVYDDIMNFIDGNDSMIGRLLDKYPALKIVIMALWEAFKALFEYLKVAAKFVADIVIDAYNLMNDAMDEFIGWLVASIQDVINWGKGFEGIFNTVSDTVVGIFKWLWNQIKQYLGWINDGLDAIKNGWKTVKGWFGFDDDAEITQTVERKVSVNGTIESQIPETPKLSEDDTAFLVTGLSQHINGMSANTMNSMTSQAISNQSNMTNETNVSIGEIKVETQATDAQGLAAVMKEALTPHLQDLGQQNNTGLSK
ncbi:hypothetical protein U0L13_000560 [Providencia stuartii]|uniref:hypothetical protein n=1 Tax=Providencia stuartii TaxID=588 RepID=UPI001FF5324F|nr:hypothetical protein [Providencia stuartii]ELZ5938406.1 hypothetical protein [Providencia stuartii]MCK1143378.1 hypothetical protein [Providencia stuartii]